MMNMMKSAAIAALMTAAAPAAYAVALTPFDTPLSAGDSTFGSALAAASEDFDMASLSFSAATDLIAMVTATIDPFLTDLRGSPLNSISLGYSLNGGAVSAMSITPVSVGIGTIGASGAEIDMSAGDVLSFFVSGVAGQSGNQVTFAVETTPPAAVPVPAAGLMLLTALGGAAALKRRKG